MESIKNNNRLIWIDYAKLIGIILVVVGHINPDNNFILPYIYSFHMPLFFILSGYLEKDNTSLQNTIKTSARMLLVPYLFFCLVSNIWWIIKLYIYNLDFNNTNLVSDTNPYNTLNLNNTFILPLMGIFIGEGDFTKYSLATNEALWFFLGLFFCRIFFRCSLLISKNKKIGFLIINAIIIIIIYWLNKFKINIYLSIDSALMALPFYIFGYLSKGKIPNNVDKKTNLIICIICILFILNFLLSIYNGWADMNHAYYGNSILIYYINGIIGSLSIILLATIISRKKIDFLVYLGMNTLTIFASHKFFLIIVPKIYSRFCSLPKLEAGFNIIESFFIAFFIIILSLIPVYIMNKFFPYILAKKINN